MNQRKSSLAVLALTVGLAGPCAAQQARSAPEPAYQQDCGYVCVYALSVDPGGQSAQTRASHLRFAEAGTATSSAQVAAPLSSPVERNQMPAASQTTWQDNPSLMDSSWRQWPSLTDF